MHTISQWIIHHNEADGNHRSKTSSCLIKMQQVKAWSPKHLTSSVPAALPVSSSSTDRQSRPGNHDRQVRWNPTTNIAVLTSEGWTTALVTELLGVNLVLSCSSIGWVPAFLSPWPHLSNLQDQNLQISLCFILSSSLCRVSVCLSSISFPTLFISGCTGSSLSLVGFL